MNAIAYIRLSTKQQVEQGNFEKYIADVEKYCEKTGLNLVDTIQEQVTGTIGIFDREGGQRLQDYVDSGTIQAVVIPDSSRLGRQEGGMTYDYQYFKHYLHERGVTLHIDGKIDPYDDTSNLVGSILAWADGRDRTRIVRRMNTEKRHALDNGKIILTGNPSYGYKKVDVLPVDLDCAPIGKDQDSYLVVNEDEADIVRTIFDWYVFEGMSLTGMAKKLNQLSIPTPGHGKRWYATSVKSILSNEFYTGVYVYGRRKRDTKTGDWIENDEDDIVRIPHSLPIIDQSVFDKADKRLQQNSKRFHDNKGNHKYLLSGMIRCGVCGRAVSARGKHRGKYWYRCTSSTKDYAECENKWHNIDAEDIEAGVWDRVLNNVLSFDNLERLLDKYVDSSGSEYDRIQSRADSVDRLIEQQQEEITKLVSDLIGFEGTARDIIKRRIADLENSINSLEQERSILQGRLTPVSDQIRDNIIDQVQEIKQNLPYINWESKRRILEWLDVKVTVPGHDNPFDLTVLLGQPVGEVEKRRKRDNPIPYNTSSNTLRVELV